MENLIADPGETEALQIALANGCKAETSKLNAYFSGVFQAEDSGEEFPVNLEHVWRIGYSRKSDAVYALRRSFEEGTDFQVLRSLPQNHEGGRPEELYKLTVSCLEYFIVRVNREVFDVYRSCRKAIRTVLRNTLPDFSNPAVAARAWADAHDAKQKALAEAQQVQQQLIEAQPKVAFFDAVAVAKNSVPMATAAKVLKIKGVGRNKLFQMLKADNILQANNEPLQRYIDAGIFEVEPQPYLAGKNGEKGPRIGCTTRVTGHGLEWLTQKYKAA